MPPLVALTFNLLFVVYLLVHDRKKKTNVTLSLWIPVIWLLITFSRPISFWFGLTGHLQSVDQLEDGSPVDRIIFALLIVAALIAISRRGVNFREVIRKNPWITLFMLYGLISILWSDFPLVSFKRWIKGIGNLLMILIVVTEPDPKEAFIVLMKRCVYFLIPLSIVLIKYFPDFGVSYDVWTGYRYHSGVALDKNMLGKLALVSSFFHIWLGLRMRENGKFMVGKTEVILNLLLLGMCLRLLQLSNSATSQVCFVFGFFLLAFVRLPFIKANIQFFGGFLIVMLIGAGLLESLFGLTEWALSILGRSPTLTGRTDIWRELLSVGSNPLIGTGYESFWLGSRLEALWQIRPGIIEAHNGFIELYLNQGLIGLGLLLGVAVVAYRNSKRELFVDFRYGALKLGYFIICIVYNLTEAGFRGLNPIWVMFIFLALRIPTQSRRQVLLE